MIAMRIEEMRGRHIDAVRAIDELAYANPWSAVTWRNELAASDRHHLVGIDGDALVGHAGLLFVLDEVHITTVAVVPDRQGEGIASELLIELLAEARRHGSGEATLEVRASHTRTQRLYARFGFQPAGARAGYYRDPEEDAIVMWLHDLCGTEARDRTEKVRVALPGAHAGGAS